VLSLFNPRARLTHALVEYVIYTLLRILPARNLVLARKLAGGAASRENTCNIDCINYYITFLSLVIVINITKK
jgi:hypothetical protein